MGVGWQVSLVMAGLLLVRRLAFLRECSWMVPGTYSLQIRATFASGKSWLRPAIFRQWQAMGFRLAFSWMVPGTYSMQTYSTASAKSWRLRARLRRAPEMERQASVARGGLPPARS